LDRLSVDIKLNKGEVRNYEKEAIKFSKTSDIGIYSISDIFSSGAGFVFIGQFLLE
jgi:hypothetical protein